VEKLMLNHISLGVADLDRAGAFYDKVFRPLGFARGKVASDQEIAYGPPGGAAFWLYPAKPGQSVVGAGTHIALTAPSRAAVDAFGIFAAEAGAKTLRKSGLHPDLSPDYYGAIITDLDGHKIEVVAEAGSTS
jgi:catechol 2,3-dioxygenase-like lactoylglutathione lyase family enzyme